MALNHKILLVGPYKNSELRIGQYLAPPLGIYRIKSYLEKHAKCAVDIIDLDLKGEDYLFEQIRKNDYAIIGFSLLQPTLKNDIPLIYKISKASPKSTLIAGGQGASFNHELLLKTTPLNMIIKGFGEFAMLKLIQNTPVNQIKGVYYKKDNQIIDTGATPELTYEQLKEVSLNFDFAKVPYEEYWRFMEKYYTKEHLEIMKNEDFLYTIRVMTSSHCPKKCTFCSSTNFLDNMCIKQKRLALTAEDMLKLVNNALEAHPRCRAVFFNDDDFLFDKERIKKLCTILKSTKKVSYFCLSRIDNYDEEMIQMMKQAGFKLIIYGVESYSNKILKQMNKNIDSNYSKLVIKKTIDAGITPLMNLMLFYPQTSEEDIIETIENAVEMVNYGARLTVYPYLEYYSGANMTHEPYNYIYEEFQAEKQRYKLPNMVLPISENIRKLAREAVAKRNELIEQILKEYNWEKVCPHPLYGLALFMAVYKLLNKDVSNIEKTINNIMEEAKNESN